MYLLCCTFRHNTPHHQCKATIFGATAEAAEAEHSVEQLSFLEDGASLHLVMSGFGFDAGRQASGWCCVLCAVGDEAYCGGKCIVVAR